MPFIGKNPTSGFSSIVKDDFTPNGTDTTFTLSKQVANANDIAVFVGNVRQEPTTAYTVNGTTLDFGSGNAPANGLDMYVLHIAGTLESSVIPADGTISSAKIISGAVTDAKIAGMSSSKLTGALPALDGSALTGAGSMVKLAHTTVASGSAGDYPFNFTNVFSSTYDMYLVAFTVASNQTGVAGIGNALYFQFGNGGTYVTASNACRGAMQYLHLNNTAVSYAGHKYYSSTGIHQVNGTLTNTEDGIFSGTALIADPFDSQFPVNIMTKIIMQYTSLETGSYGEEGYSREDNGDKASYTDFRMGIIAGNSGGSDISYTAPRRNAYGHVTVYGLVK